MKITYIYKLFKSDDIFELVISESEYFDPIKKGEKYETDGIAKFDDSRNYVSDLEKSDFEWDVLVVSGSKSGAIDRSIRTEYFANGESEFVYRKDKCGYELIIQSFVISSNEIFISRISRKGMNKPWVNTNFSLGENFHYGGNEKWYNLKKGELKG